MLITVIPKEKSESKEIPYKDIRLGMVYTIDSGIVLLKLYDNKAIVLAWPNGEDFLQTAYGCKDRLATKILGRLKEIIVEEV